MFLFPRHPILVFCLEDFGIDSLKFTNYLKRFFFDLEWDWYLYCQQQLEYLIDTVLNAQPIPEKLNNLFCAYYKGEIEASVLEPLTKLLNAHQKSHFQSIQPTRRRAMQAYDVSFSASNIMVIPTNKRSFTQQEALNLKSYTDWRTLKRLFYTPPSRMLSSELEIIIKKLAKLIHSYHPTVHSMSIYVHFTQIIAKPDAIATNSPEGIHQDGMEYIVSALVIDRENVCGGKSIIYSDNNPHNAIFETTLRNGYGIFQPDKGTNLWHLVEPITPLDKSKPAYRSTIGFDFELHGEINALQPPLVE